VVATPFSPLARRRAGVLGAAFFVTISAFSAEVLFPRPIHVVREVSDSISASSTRLDQYFTGDRAITIRGTQTVIADYAKQELTEIDRRAGTYSVTPFAQLAAARSNATVRGLAGETPAVANHGSDHRAGRSVALFTADSAAQSLHVDAAIDPSVILSRAALDVVIGAAFPDEGGAASDLVRAVASQQHRVETIRSTSQSSQPAADSYGLPLEQRMRWQSQGEEVVLTNRVVTLDEQMPSPELLTIPAGARRIDGRAVSAQRTAADADTLTPSRTAH
jgi:hypothetical protein